MYDVPSYAWVAQMRATGRSIPKPIKYVQIPSGTAANPDAKILIGAGATINVDRVLQEIGDLGLTPDRLSIDPNAIIIEESDIQFESKTLEVIGSTKQGVGAATARKILCRDGGQHLGASATTSPAIAQR